MNSNKNKISDCVCGSKPSAYRSHGVYYIECCYSECFDGNNKVCDDSAEDAINHWNKFIRYRKIDLKK